MSTSSRVWFITGVSRGLGKALAERVLADGEIVIGTTRDGSTSISDTTGRLHVLALEITDPQAIVAAVGQAQALHGRLDVIVNNAGYGLLGSVEEATEEAVTHLFEVDFHGPRRIIQSVLPHLRRQNSGHIVNITSIAGLAPNAGSGFYSAAKFAVEGLSQTLAQEVAPFNIKVTLVEPGAFRTDFLSDHSLRAHRPGAEAYASTVGASMDRLESMAGKQIGDPARGAEAIVRAVSAAEPPLHLVLGSDALQRTRDMLARFSAELERWSSVSASTDYG